MKDGILCVANYAPDEGYAWWLMENFWIQLAGVACNAGMQAIVVYPSEGDVPQRLTAAGLQTKVFPFPGRGFMGLFRSLRFVRQHQIRLIYFTDRNFTGIAYGLFRLAGVRAILNHDHTPGDRPYIGGIKGSLKSLWRKLPWVNADLQVCVSPLIRDRAVRNAKIPLDRTVVVQNGIEPIRCDVRDKGYAHRHLNISDAKKICITVGRAHPYKRIDFVVRVAKRVINDYGRADIAFVHCGDGPGIAELQRLALDLGVVDDFVFAGKRSDMRELLCSSDLAIHAAKGEAFSLAVLEYMSAQLPVVVPDVPSVAQAIQDDVTGVVFPDGDCEYAAKLLVELLDNPLQREEMGKLGAQHVEDRYALNAMNKRFREVTGQFFSQGGDTPLGR